MSVLLNKCVLRVATKKKSTCKGAKARLGEGKFFLGGRAEEFLNFFIKKKSVSLPLRFNNNKKKTPDPPPLGD